MTAAATFQLLFNIQMPGNKFIICLGLVLVTFINGDYISLIVVNSQLSKSSADSRSVRIFL